MTEERSAGELLDEARRWWTTSIIDIHPGEIAVRGYPIEQLIGNVTFPQMIWLMLMGEFPTESQATLLEAALVAGADHGPQAPSIAISRMAATCGPSLNGVMVSTTNVLSDIHGGPGEQCMEIYYKISVLAGAGGDLESATAEVVARRKVSGLKYFLGFGHHFHPPDLHAPRLFGMVREAAATGDVSGHFATIGTVLEDTLSKGRVRRIPVNVDGATAVIHHELGLAPELGRGVLILSRSIGILAHAWEQMQQGGWIKGPQAKLLNYTYDGLPCRDLTVARTNEPTKESP